MTVSHSELLLYAGALVILFLTPGPVWLALLARAMSGGFAAAWPLAFGVAIGDIFWPLVAVLGMSWIVSVFDVFMGFLRWIACLVFVGLGVLLLFHAKEPINTDSRLARPGIWAGFLSGVLVIIGNPKAVLFYMGVLPGFFDLRNVTRVDVAAILMVSVMVPLTGNLLLAGFVGRVRLLLSRPNTLVQINRASGALLILVGVLIPLL